MQRIKNMVLGDEDLYAILEESKQLKSEFANSEKTFKESEKQEQIKSNGEISFPEEENHDVDRCDGPKGQFEKQKYEDISRARQIGLKFKVTRDFLELINREVLPQKGIKLTPEASPTQARKIDKPLKCDVLMLKIGSWKTVAQNLEDVLAKCYFGKKLLVWEMLENRLKKKIQIPWEHILAMRATIDENKPEVLEIELSEPPSFLRETRPEPRKHTKWEKATDFTYGQATICRRHHLQFPRGTLEKYYSALLNVPEFLNMSQNHFPTMQSPHFSAPDFNNVGRVIFSLDRQENMLQTNSLQQPPCSKDSQNVYMNSVSYNCTGIYQKINFVQEKPNVEDLVNGGGTDFALACYAKEPQANNFQQPSDSNMPMSVTPLQACNQDFSLISDLFGEYDGTPLDELLKSFGDENDSNMTLLNQPMSDHADTAQRDVLSRGQVSTAPPATFQENSVVPHQDYNNLPLSCNDEILRNQDFQLPMNDKWFPAYSNLAEGFNEAREKTDHSSSKL